MTSKKRFLLAAFLGVLFLHVTAVLLIRDMKMEGGGYVKRGVMENHLRLGADVDALEKLKQEIRTRNEQLSLAFRELKIDRHEKLKTDQQLKEHVNQYSDIDIDAIHTLKESLPLSEHSPDFDPEAAFLADGGEQLIFAEEKRLAKELVSAAEAPLGLVAPLPALARLNSAPALKAGNTDGRQPEGIDSENRSGLVDGGLTGEGLEHLSGIIASDGGSGTHIASSDDFIVQVEYAPNPEGEGYLFRAVLSPKQGASFKRIRQNLFFLIDRSHSIPEARYLAAKHAVAKALAMLHPDDTFNILIFDKNISRFSKANVPCTKENLFSAAEFLKKEPYGGMFATTDLYSSLGSIVPEEVAENEVNTAILFSDGDTYLKPGKQRAVIQKWTEQNSGKVALYCIASGSGNNLPLLDLISTFNKGTLHFSSRNEELPQIAGKLLAGIQTPIGKEIAVTAVPLDKDPGVSLSPPGNRLPHLYSSTPYVLYGTVRRLDDFYLFVQGKHYDKWLGIKRKVVFGKAKKVDPEELQRLWALQRAYNEYENYLKLGNMESLKRARDLLEPFNIPSAL